MKYRECPSQDCVAAVTPAEPTSHHHTVHSFIWGWVLGEIFPIRVGSSRDILRMCNINSWWHITDGSMHGVWWRGTSHTDWTTQDNMCCVVARRHSHSCPIVQKSVSRLGWVVSSVEGHHSGQAAGSQSPSPSQDNTQQRGEKGAAKSKKWFEFSMKRSPLCWRLFTPDIATPPLPPPHRRTAGVWTFLLGWRRRHVLKSWHSYFYFHCFISLGWDIWQQKRILNLNLIKTQ